MTSYLLAYDLRNESGSHDYQPLWDELERFGAQRTQYSLWLVSTDAKAKPLHDHFKKYLDDDDRLWVNEVVRNKHYSKAIAGTNAWLDENPPVR